MENKRAVALPLGLLLLAVFVLVPIAEIATFIQVGDVIGLWPTLALIVLTALLGSLLIRHQGLGLVNRARAEMDRGRPPVRELFSGLCLIVAGALLLTPGFLTDTVGFVLLFPPVQETLRRRLAKGMAVRVARQEAGRGRRRPGPQVIEADYEEVDPNDMPPPRGGWDKR